MATIDLTQATRSISMSDASLVEFGNAVEKTATSWSWITPSGNDIDLNGSGLTYNANGKAQSGTINFITIDAGNNSPSNPDIVIKDIAANATQLPDGFIGFWKELLSGDDTFLGPLKETAGVQAQFFLFGDSFNANEGGFGGDDLFRAGNASTNVAGDVSRVDANVDYQGGADRIFGAPTDLRQSFAGDASVVDRGTLTGGDDFIISRSSNGLSFAAGDASAVFGNATGQGVVIGGDDRITGEDGSAARLIGDVRGQGDNTRVQGGKDTINGGALGEIIVGDVDEVDEVNSATVIGGDDTLNGNGGDDTIAGDVGFSVFTVAITGGNDVIHGGEGNDRIFGELANGTAAITGGNDQLFGDAGDDQLFGQTGNDRLDGGTGADRLDGGAGADTAVYATSSAAVTVDLTLGKGTGGDAAGDSLTGIEGLNGSAFGDVLTGNAANNLIAGLNGDDVIRGAAGTDNLFGQNGNDFIDGGVGADRLDGGDAFDFAVYTSATAGVVANLSNAALNTGDAKGDTYFSIEALRGSAFGDTLTGDGNTNVLAGDGGNDVLSGLGGSDAIAGGAGSDTMSGGLGSDRFIFAKGTGADRVTDFAAGDVLDLKAFKFASFAAVKALASDTAEGLKIDFGGGDGVILNGFKLAAFDAADVIL